MAGNEVTVDSLIAMLRNEGNQGTEKVAYSRQDVADTTNVELLNKIAEDMNHDEVLKQAAAARVSGNIMADIILEKVASQLAPAMAQAVHEKIASILPAVVAEVVPMAVKLALEKVAVGTSTVISGNLSKSVPNDGSATDLQMEEDRIGKKMGDRTSKYWGAEETSGASVSGGGAGALEGGAGDKPEAWQPVHKLSAARKEANQYLKAAEKEKAAFLSAYETDPNVTVDQYRAAQKQADEYIKTAQAEVSAFLKQAELEQDLARYEELQAKKAAGALTPEEEQELQMLEQKLMAAAQGAAGGAAPGAGAPAGGMPGEAGPPGGGAPMGPGGSMGDGMTLTAAEKKAAVQALINKHIKKAA